jgi:hypothetical protein
MKRRKKNTIKRLVDQIGTMQTDGEVLCNIVYNYFENLFTTEVADQDPNVLSDVQHVVTPAMNSGLMAPFSYKEVRKALFRIGDFKAPGPDGMHAIFYKKF